MLSTLSDDEHWLMCDSVIGYSMFGAVGILVVAGLTAVLCNSYCKRKQRPAPAPAPAPGTIAAPSQEMASLSTVAGDLAMVHA